MEFLKKFILKVVDEIEEKILDKPLHFLGVTGFFALFLYESRDSFCIDDYVYSFVFYIFMLVVFLSNDKYKNRG